jgi:coproporphyrinogen III oxidase-like Fe-S oxidoreductase
MDSLIGGFFRRNFRRLMRFPSAPGEIRLPDPAPKRDYLLYLHIPFCVVLCPFCSFHRVEFKENRARQYFRALRKEIRMATDGGYRFGELYVGGGTPTVLPDELVETIELVRSLHPIENVSVETNPHDLDVHNLSQLRAAGVSRLSVGVQSFDDNLLREMQRYDKYGSAAEIQDHLRLVDKTFDTLNVDMIFNFPHQDQASLTADLETLTGVLSVDQVSFYPLMSADSTSKAMHKDIGVADYSRERRFYEIIVEHMLDAGYVRSSAWCFCRRPGMLDEYIVEHEEYLGLGSGAFSYLDGGMYANTFSINHYLRLIEAGKSSCVRHRHMSTREQMRYHLLMQLFGGALDKAAAEERFGGRLQSMLHRELTGLHLVGAITDSADTIKLTESGYYLWVVMMQEFFSGVNNFRNDMRQHISEERSVLPLR